MNNLHGAPRADRVESTTPSAGASPAPANGASARAAAARAPDGGGTPWISLFVVGVGVLASLLLASALERAQRVELARDVDGAVESIGENVERRLDEDFAALRSELEVWQRYGPRPAEEWTGEARAFMGLHPGFAALVHMNPKSGNTVASTPDGLQVLREVAQVMGRSFEDARLPPVLQGERVVGPLVLSDGSKAIGFQIPVTYAATKTHAVVFGAFLPDAALRPVLEGLAPHFAVRLEAGDVVLHASGEPVEDADSYWRRERELTPSLGPALRLVVAPTPALVRSAIGDVGPFVAAAGSVISLLLGFVVHLGQLAATRARALEATNESLRDRIDELSRAESEIRELNTGLEARVAQRTAEMNDVIAELETFNYSVSHDLRSPLGAILNFSAILGEDYRDLLDDAGREYLGRITGSAQSAVAMMNALLAFSRSGRDEMHQTRIAMTPLVESVFRELAMSAPGKAPVLELEALPPAFGDKDMIRLVVSNLLSNALKFSGASEQPRIAVHGRETADATEYAVTDNGVGFDMRHAEKLFHVFERLHNRDTFGGEGVGLAIVARIVRRHGGRVRAEGAPGKGATFWFSLPRAAEEAPHKR